MTTRGYIKNSKPLQFRVKGVKVIQTGKFTGNFSPKESIEQALESIPQHLLGNLDSIYIGDYEFLKAREINAAYKDAAIFVSNEQDNNQDLADDIVHEVAHSIEETHQELIYSDKSIEREFLNKRRELYSILATEGYKAELIRFINPEYDSEFDQFLYKEVGYSALSMLSVNLFYSPYGATSLREYFANGFEALFHHRDVERIRAISPNLFDKLTKLVYSNREE